MAARLRSDPGKLAIAARLRHGTTLAIKWIAARVQIGTPKGAQSLQLRLASGKAVRPNEPYAQLQFESTGWPRLGISLQPVGFWPDHSGEKAPLQRVEG